MRGGALALAAVAGAYGSLDSMLNIAFPDLVDGLSIEVTDLQWIIVAFVLAYGGLLVGAGRLGDQLGHQRTLSWGGVISAFGMSVCGAAPNLGVLIGGRVVQGIGTALVMASAPALVTRTVGAERRGQALGIFQMSAAIGLAVGPLLGGPLVAVFGWRAVFWIRVPVGLALALLMLMLKARDQNPVGARADLFGPVLFALTVGSGLLAMNLGLSFGPLSPPVIALAVAAIGLGSWLVHNQTATDDPVIDLGLLRQPTFRVANLLNLVANGAAFVGWLFVPEYVVDVLGSPEVVGGVVLAASPACMATVAPWAGRLSDRFGAGTVSAGGLVIQTVGLASGIATARAESVLGLGLSLALVGVGLGLFTVPNMSFIMGSLPEDRQGVAGGLTLTMRTAGIVIGVAGLSAIFGARESAGFGIALADTFMAATAATAVAALVSLFRSARR